MRKGASPENRERGVPEDDALPRVIVRNAPRAGGVTIIRKA